MKRIYSHPNFMLVGLVQSALDRAGIDVHLKNDLAGGGAGELAPIDMWPELWLVNEHQFEEANKVISQFKNENENPTWHCSLCGEDNDSSFEFCWNCGGLPPQDFSNT